LDSAPGQTGSARKPHVTARNRTYIYCVVQASLSSHHDKGEVIDGVYA
jgi:hypothetical protein